MRIAILGAGIVGVATARALVEDGHEITVFERRGSVGAEASFAPSGLLAPDALALGGPLAGLSEPPRGSGLGGVLQAWRSGRAPASQQRRSRLARLAAESQAALARWFDPADPPFERSLGVGLRLRDAAERQGLEALLAASSLPGAAGRSRWLDREAWTAAEPDLAPDAPGAGLLFWPGAEMVNVRQVAQQLREQAEARGVRFALGVGVHALQPGPTVTLGLSEGETAPRRPAAATLPRRSTPTVLAAEGPLPTRFDAVILCTGTATGLLPGKPLPLRREAGLSLTLPLRDPDRGPVHGLIDADGELLLTRLGDRLRVAGLWHRPTADGQPPRALVERLYRAAQRDYPGLTQTGRGQVWCGVHGAWADGLPRIGRSELPGVWLNLGHGRAGWALAAGSGLALAAELAGRAAAPAEPPTRPGTVQPQPAG